MLSTTRENGRERAEIGLKFMCWFGGKAQYSLSTLVVFHVFFHYAIYFIFFLVLRIWKWCVGAKLQLKLCSHLLFSFKRNKFPTEIGGNRSFCSISFIYPWKGTSIWLYQKMQRICPARKGQKIRELKHLLINISLQGKIARKAMGAHFLIILRVFMWQF